MSRTSRLTSRIIMTFREELEQKRDTIKVKEFIVMSVKDLDILKHNALHISRNKKRRCLFLSLMMITLKVNLRRKLLNM